MTLPHFSEYVSGFKHLSSWTSVCRRDYYRALPGLPTVVKRLANCGAKLRNAQISRRCEQHALKQETVGYRDEANHTNKRLRATATLRVCGNCFKYRQESIATEIRNLKCVYIYEQRSTISYRNCGAEALCTSNEMAPREEGSKTSEKPQLEPRALLRRLRRGLSDQELR